MKMNKIRKLFSDLSKNELSTILILSSVPLSKFSFDIGFSLKPFMLVAVLMFVVYYHDLRKDIKLLLKNGTKFEKIYLLFIVSYSMTFILAKYKSSSVRLIFGLLLISGIYIIFKYILVRVNRGFLVKTIFWVGLIFNIVSLILYIIGAVNLGFDFHGNQMVSYGIMLDRNVPRLIGLLSDPNFFVMYNLLFVSVFLTVDNIKVKLTTSSIGILNVLLTASRSGLIALVIMLFLFFVKTKTWKKFNFKKVVLGFILISLLLCVVLLIFKIDLFGLIISRFLVNDGGTGRVGLIVKGWNMFLDSNFLGIGIFNFRPMNIDIHGTGHFLHNTFAEILFEGGFITFGFFIYSMIILIKMAQKLCKNDKNNVYLYSTFIGVFVMMSTLSIIINEMLMLVLLLINIYYQNDLSKKEI